MSIAPSPWPRSPAKAWHLMQPSPFEPTRSRPLSTISASAWPAIAGIVMSVFGSSARRAARGLATSPCHFGIKVYIVERRSTPPFSSTSSRNSRRSLSPTPSSVGGSRPSSPISGIGPVNRASRAGSFRIGSPSSSRMATAGIAPPFPSRTWQARQLRLVSDRKIARSRAGASAAAGEARNASAAPIASRCVSSSP